jgi:hypothetical protein
MAAGWPDYHGYTRYDWNHILAEGPHAAALLGETDDVVCKTLSALFTFMLPIMAQAFARTKRQHLLAVYFALDFAYIRYYAPVETPPRWFHWGPGHKTDVSRGAFYTMAVPITKLCSVSLRELNWDDRLDYNNQQQSPPARRPERLGTTGDGTQFEELASEHRCYPNECGYGGTAYSDCPGVLNNYELIPQGTRPSIPITPTENAFNENMHRVRARIGHPVAEHRRGRMMFNTKYMGGGQRFSRPHTSSSHMPTGGRVESQALSTTSPSRSYFAAGGPPFEAHRSACVFASAASALL